MIQGVKQWFSANWPKLLAGAIAALAAFVGLNILTGGAITAALPAIMQVFGVVMGGVALANIAGHVGDYLSKGWAGDIAGGAKSLARGLAAGAVELVFALLFNAGALIKALKGGLKGTAKAAKGAAKNTVKTTLKSVKDLGQISAKGAKTALKNGKIMLGGVKGGFAKGAKSLDDLAQRLVGKLRFNKFKIRRQGRRIKLLGHINPWIVITESGEIKFRQKQTSGAIEVTNDELRTLRSIDKTTMEDLTAEFGTETVKEFIKRLKGQGVKNIFEAGGKDALKLVEEVFALEKNGKVAELDDWVKFLLEKNKKGQDLLNVLAELQEAKRVAAGTTDEVVRVGGDARVLPDKFGNTPKSFDLTVENKAGAVTRNIDVTTIKDPIEGSSDFRDGLKHAIEKAPVAKQGSIESTIQVEIPDSPVQLEKGRQKHFSSDGRYAITELNGESRTQGDLVEELQRYIIKNFGTKTVLNRVNVVDRNGALIATLENVNGTWKISARYK
jgi:hypothetical protein